MGRNRELIKKLTKYVNICSQYKKKDNKKSGILINAQQWQTLECIIEYEDENKNMIYMANQLGLPKSTFSKHVKYLVEYGLIDRYQYTDNLKDIFLKPSDKGREYYKERSNIILKVGWQEPFAVLDKLPDESMAIIVEFISMITSELGQEKNKVKELFKLQDSSIKKE